MNPPLVLAAHGSTDPRFAGVITSLASLIGDLRPALEVRIGYLEHGPPCLGEVSGAGCVVVPVLLTNGYHVHVDLPVHANGARLAAALGPDRRLATVMADRLRTAGWQQRQPVVLAAAGSVDNQALDDAQSAATFLSVELGVEVTVAFIGSGSPRLRDLAPAAVVPYLIAPGIFYDAIGRTSATVIAAPLGADPVIAQILLDRYDAACATVADSAPSLARGY